jgi:hypothetical protein
MAGQNVTVSFWAKASTSTTIFARADQDFGSGGSSRFANGGSGVSVSTTWERKILTFPIASISGKTIGSSSYLDFFIYWSNTSAQTVDLWGIQIEQGNQATIFHNSTPNQQTELAACQRYYYRTNTNDSTAYGVFGFGYSFASNLGLILVNFPVTMRTTPNAFDYQLHGYINYNNAGRSLTSIAVNQATRSSCWLQYNITGGVQGEPAFAQMNAGSGYLGFSAEL